MAIESIPYVELFTDEPVEARHYLAEHLGFRPFAAAGETSVALRNGPVVVVVTAPSRSGDPIERYLEAHGSGIADVAMSSTDVGGDRARAIAAGATPAGGTAVGGFGPVRHTLVAAHAEPLPPDRGWQPAGPAAGPGGSLAIRALDHVAVCLPGGTLQSTADFYGAALGLGRYSSEYIEVGTQAMDSVVVRSSSGGVTFTLIEPDETHTAGQIDEFLRNHGGAGVQHLAFLVEDIVTAVRRATAGGLPFLSTPDSYYEMLTSRLGHLAESIDDLRETNVLADRDEWGYLLQIFTRSPYPRRTLFFELIQRHDARGFGSANIKALYEAVERDRARDAARAR
ncbi:4-hydroxyphenylpyruvate dioxygenase [Paractinoplanes hotanensis]|uniref:4-hydroxyphenylpyruvate dioxygenase n=1 Tax=Paractinoplanes hotanensis TaxID=2906497 RepID=A0ABT0YC98_9ACTN|nr:4-hydroxyphenylpyruvate dioxygenase [Actinoplanes hotanensis]MCM4083118.1 4-hydroxyphenylpyruvate dioxygenase [Actinoplanes hotanensis]